MQTIRNIAILAHVDAGKTTLSERILFTTGEVRRPGKVEEGLATMDYMPEEKERGITIESGVAHFEWKNVWFNFIDTPGHIDFGAEVDMALSAVEGAVLVVSAASGVETQTVTAFKKLQERGIRTLIFINKLDNTDYSLDETLINIEEILGVRPVLMTVPEYKKGKLESVLDVLSKSRLTHDENDEETVEPLGDSSGIDKLYKEAVDFAAHFDDDVLSLAMDNKPVPPRILLQGLKKLAESDEYALCYAGSAMEGFGVRSLITALSFFLPPTPDFSARKIPALGQIIRLRHFRGVGEISLFRSHVNLDRKKWPAGFEFSRLKANLLVPVTEIRSGDIYAMAAPLNMELGQVILTDGSVFQAENGAEDISSQYKPLLQTRVECISSEDFNHVKQSLSVLSRMDPSFKVVYNEEGGYWHLLTVGEVQLEVLLARLKREFDCSVRAGSPEVQWQERLGKKLNAVENSFQAGPHKISICLSAEPLESEAHDIRLSAEFLENAPREILAGVRSALLESTEVGVLGKGPLVGVRFEVISFEWTADVIPQMIKKACADAVTKLIKPADVYLLEPYMELSLECPVTFAGLVTDDIQARGGKVKEIGGDGRTHFLKAEIPLRKIFGYATGVRSISKGTAVYSLKLLDYRKFVG
ncbi:MAG: GTP-binding protein [Fibrobacteraceae bacterium]|nr:GTP-binding protein [Fibrobacteraceae bacterium]